MRKIETVNMETDTRRFSLPRWLLVVLVGRNPRFTLVRIAVLVAVVVFVRMFVLLPIRVKGPSMMPTYQDSGINFVNRLAYAFSEPKRFDVVAIRTSGTSIMYMKRIIGLPGETVEFHKGRAYIDGQLLEEPYVKTDCDWESPPKSLGPDWYYVVGDNRSMPELLHEEGRTRRERIVGKILLWRNLFASSSSSP